jgi:hypothetical protein
VPCCCARGPRHCPPRPLPRGEPFCAGTPHFLSATGPGSPVTAAAGASGGRSWEPECGDVTGRGGWEVPAGQPRGRLAAATGGRQQNGEVASEWWCAGLWSPGPGRAGVHDSRSRHNSRQAVHTATTGGILGLLSSEGVAAAQTVLHLSWADLLNLLSDPHPL